MKKIFFLIALNIISIALFGQINNETTFSESEIILKTSTGDIYGLLTIPNNLKKTPIVLIIAGSGPTDRDGNSPINLHTNAYKMLSEELAINGISALRFDKRGIGISKSAMTKESDLRFETYINDVVDWISLLKSDKRFSKIIILGHSEGSLIGMIAANQTKISGFISIAGVGNTADKVLQEQLINKLPPQLLNESNKILDSLKLGKTVKNVNPYLFSIYRPSVQPYMISWIKYNPVKEISKLKIPTLIIQGTSDIQVKIDNANLLSASKPDAKLVIIENMNHILKESSIDIQENMATYNNPDLPLKSELSYKIIDFIKGITK
ncbi:MAG: alpha/beta hydrolase [Bacteroidales bacterium]|nr:alpha/beta hydrolase [Bacteroidales bacterium]MBN2755683.1 alpha/beta hydrolase [Bacteroidales bacterium]